MVSGDSGMGSPLSGEGGPGTSSAWWVGVVEVEGGRRERSVKSSTSGGGREDAKEGGSVASAETRHAFHLLYQDFATMHTCECEVVANGWVGGGEGGA